METILELKDLEFGYSKDKILFSDLSLSLKKGELKSITGESGAGKSTVFELILGNLKPLKGSVKVTKVAQVFQDPYSSFHPSYTLINQIKDVAPLTELQHYLEVLDLEKELLEKLPHQLSGG
ncbi:MAG: ATP-binding cassette domain-containing protein, partial [Sulfurimonas sp.]